MNRLFAYGCLVFIGTNCANYYSTELMLFAWLVMVGVIWFSLHGMLLSKTKYPLKTLLVPDIALWILLLVIPIIFMLLSFSSFEKSIWTSRIFAVLVFWLGAMFGANVSLRQSIVYGALTIIVIASLMNLYEFFVESNVWSISPGRSAGFYVNPNISAANIAVYAIIYLGLRRSIMIKYDFLILAIVFSGIAVTFSRTGYILFLFVASMMFFSRSGFVVTKRAVLEICLVVSVVAVLSWVFIDVILPGIELTDDASGRLLSWFASSLVTNYAEQRGELALQAWQMVLKSPLTGFGVNSMFDMGDDAPHNMFIGLAVDYGVFGTAAYIALILSGFVGGIRRLDSDARGGVLLITMLAWLVTYSFASHTIIYDSTNLLAISLSATIGRMTNSAQNRDRSGSPRLRKYRSRFW